ncbi:hypothetical protein BDY19DRAFT_1060378 [Irpex rosettiformis]|uniref:Uncharacterized protein n=1 Tax=Irpex rosettiformis TaxID=378272 RepID=A0ACB8TQN8_9APHY|nr:hypothetical protein BDY19DRAFT_1060378 [Irpex rosettiformis]
MVLPTIASRILVATLMGLFAFLTAPPSLNISPRRAIARGATQLRSLLIAPNPAQKDAHSDEPLSSVQDATSVSSEATESHELQSPPTDFMSTQRTTTMKIASPAVNCPPIVPKAAYWYTESERSNTCLGLYSQLVSSNTSLDSDQPLVPDPPPSGVPRQLVARNPLLGQALPFTIPETNIGLEDTLPLATIPSAWIVVILFTATAFVLGLLVRLTISLRLHRALVSNTRSGGTANPATSTSDHFYPPIVPEPYVVFDGDLVLPGQDANFHIPDHTATNLPDSIQVTGPQVQQQEPNVTPASPIRATSGSASSVSGTSDGSETSLILSPPSVFDASFVPAESAMFDCSPLLEDWRPDSESTPRSSPLLPQPGQSLVSGGDPPLLPE